MTCLSRIWDFGTFGSFGRFASGVLPTPLCYVVTGEAMLFLPLFFFFFLLWALFLFWFAASWSRAWQRFLLFASVRVSLFALLVKASGFLLFLRLWLFASLRFLPFASLRFSMFAFCCFFLSASCLSFLLLGLLLAYALPLKP